MPVINFTLDSVISDVPGPCVWPLDTTCCPGWADYDPNVQARATTMATFILDALTGRQFSQCAVNYRPCGPKCSMTAGYMAWPVGLGVVGGGSLPWMLPWIDGGTWRNCACPGTCGCAARCSVPIPFSVASIVQVTLDGVVLDPSAYRLDSWRGIPDLVRTDGECWPQCQDMNVSGSEVGSFVITFRPGLPLPQAGAIAAGELACELAKACVGSDCALPSQLTSMTRNGVDIEVLDPNQILADRKTGIRNVDLFIEAVNPYARTQPSRVRSVDSYRGRLT